MPDTNPRLHLATDGVDPNRVPKRTLYTGAQMPAIGLGTFGSDHYPAETIAQAVLTAAEVGYRHFDCAAVYANEHLIGPSLETIQASGVPREELFVTSKLWNDSHGEGAVLPACRKTLSDLRLDYLDMYLIHWPFPNHHPPGCDASARSPHARPYIHEDYMRTWRQMERLVEMGLVRHIGTSNMTIPKLELVLRDAEVPPACNQMELHPHMQQPELFEFVVAHGIVPVGYCPIGSPNRPARDTSPGDSVDIADPVIVTIAHRLGVHPAVVCVKWAEQRGQVPIPLSVKRSQQLANLQALVSAPLAEEEMQAIASIDRNCRLIKGHVFLWEGAASWEDLWDPSGTVSGSLT